MIILVARKCSATKFFLISDFIEKCYENRN